jgi:AraC family transcriptional regulator, exoenzyme S synthesis regulatory protein ExsA
LQNPEKNQEKYFLLKLNRIHYPGKKNILLKSDGLLKGYFQSLLPYVEEWKKVSKKLAVIKVNEAIELLLQSRMTITTIVTTKLY